MLKLDLEPFADKRISYAFNSDGLIRGVRDDYAFRWNRVYEEIFLVGSVPLHQKLDGLTRKLLPEFFPVLGSDRMIYTVNRKIIAVESLSRMRFVE